MAFFKTKVAVADYCGRNLATLFAVERETTLEALRTRCNDAHLNQVNPNLYYDHFRAAMIELMLIAVSRNCSPTASSAAHFFVMDYLNKRGLQRIDSLCGEYNRAFASSGFSFHGDGVAEIVQWFSASLTQSNMGELATEQFYTEFYSMLKVFFDDFKSIKLVAP